jgi:hypothetical protein
MDQNFYDKFTERTFDRLLRGFYVVAAVGAIGLIDIVVSFL